MHSDIGAMERMEIIRDLRMAKFDVLVGINLLREGLDLPEVSLVAILCGKIFSVKIIVGENSTLKGYGAFRVDRVHKSRIYRNQSRRTVQYRQIFG